jgi:hypothetical protein
MLGVCSLLEIEKISPRTRIIIVFSVLGFLMLGIISGASQNIGVGAKVEPLDGYDWFGPYYVSAAARSDGYQTKTFIGYQSACASPQSVYPTGSSYTWYPAEWHPSPLYTLTVHIYNPNPYAIEVKYMVQAYGN